MTQYIQIATATTLTHIATRPIDDGSSATLDLYTSAGGSILSDEACTIGASTTVDDTTEAGDETLPIAATTGLSVGDEILALNDLGQSEWIKIAGITADTSITTRHPLRYAYASGDRVHAPSLSVAIDATTITDVSTYLRAAWTYVSNGQTITENTVIHAVKYDPSIPLTSQALLLMHPLGRSFVDPDQPLDEVIAEVWQTEILPDLISTIPPGTFIDTSILKKACRYATLAQIYYSNDKYDEGDHWTEKYEAAKAQVITEQNIDSDSDGSVDDEETRSYYISRLRRG